MGSGGNAARTNAKVWRFSAKHARDERRNALASCVSLTRIEKKKVGAHSERCEKPPLDDVSTFPPSSLNLFLSGRRAARRVIRRRRLMLKKLTSRPSALTNVVRSLLTPQAPHTRASTRLAATMTSTMISSSATPVSRFATAPVARSTSRRGVAAARRSARAFAASGGSFPAGDMQPHAELAIQACHRNRLPTSLPREHQQSDECHPAQRPRRRWLRRLLVGLHGKDARHEG